MDLDISHIRIGYQKIVTNTEHEAEEATIPQLNSMQTIGIAMADSRFQMRLKDYHVLE